MNRTVILIAALAVSGCQQDRAPDPYDLDFEIPRTHDFADSLKDYGLFEEPIADLQPADGAVLYELSSELFTDYAYKQRLVIVPEGESITVKDDDTLEYPEGTIMAKTFYYPDDMRETDGPRTIIETRLLTKTEGIWNVATYVWNDEQTDATPLPDGLTVEMAWVDEDGESRSTNYEVPHEGQCVTCHQQDGDVAFIGPTLQNLNRAVVRDEIESNQLDYLRSAGLLIDGDWSSVPRLPDYRDTDQSLETRARAYLDINCAHCHSPGRWNEAADKDYDLRYTTPLDETGLSDEPKRLTGALEDGEMPFIGTTIAHDEGIQLVLEYVDSLGLPNGAAR